MHLKTTRHLPAPGVAGGYVSSLGALCLKSFTRRMIVNRKYIVALTLASGFVGSLVSRYLAPPRVFAQVQKASKEIQAQNFVLVNAQGRPMGLFGFNPQGKPIIRILDDQGRVVWTTEVPLVPGAPEPK